MNPEARSDLGRRGASHLERLCAPPDRRPGSTGNDDAVDYTAGVLADLGWAVSFQEFECMDWETTGGSVTIGGRPVDLTPSPYGLGAAASGPVRVVRSLEELARADLTGAVAVVAGDLASEPLTPKGFPFYASDEHTRIVAALEEAEPAAVIAVTGRYPALCGALDPFPFIEDGDFTVPTANLRSSQAGRLLAAEGEQVDVEIRSRRWPARARNVVAGRGPVSSRVTVIAHIDTKPGTPGAVDNAAGVVALLLAGELLSAERHRELPVGVELLAVNGEDHFGAPGEVAWLASHDLEDVALAVNIDGAGYRAGRTAFSTYNLDERLEAHVDAALGSDLDLVRGPDWYQSDHAIFAMRGRPALAFTTERVQEMLEELFHSPSDTPDEVDARLLVGIAAGIERMVSTWPQ